MFLVGANDINGGHYNPNVDATTFSFVQDCPQVALTYEGDTCSSIASTWNMTLADFIGLNYGHSGISCATGDSVLPNQLVCVTGTVSADKTVPEWAPSAESSPTTTATIVSTTLVQSGAFSAFEASAVAMSSPSSVATQQNSTSSPPSNSASNSAAAVTVGSSAVPLQPATTLTSEIPLPETTAAPVAVQTKSSDPFHISNSQFPVSCQYYLDTVSGHSGESVYSTNVNNNGYTLFDQYNCNANVGARCTDSLSSYQWSGDQDWVWNKAISSSTDPYRYNVIWFMQLIGDSDDLFHECDDDPSAFKIADFASEPLNLKPDCLTFGKWCRAWAGHVAQKTQIDIQGQSYSVEDAFLMLSSDRIKIDFMNEDIYASYLRSGVSITDQQDIASQFAAATNQGNCITDQHFCAECNGDYNHCSIAQGCLMYANHYCP
ncbi:hypothetical protein HDU82_006503 [Entophlyctis luteolus]|nr:hypothetical protein HDU82_006503 [Entophlyctis luteolus]